MPLHPPLRPGYPVTEIERVKVTMDDPGVQPKREPQALHGLNVVGAADEQGRPLRLGQHASHPQPFSDFVGLNRQRIPESL